MSYLCDFIIDISEQTFDMASESLGVSRSLVWNFFKVSEENDTAKCATCDKIVKREVHCLHKC